MMIIDPRQYLADPLVRPFLADRRVDLVAANVPTAGTGRFIICTLTPEPNSVYVIKGFFPYAMERVNVGTPAEEFRMLASADANGYFAFEPVLSDGKSAFDVSLDYNRPKTAAAASDVERQRSSGITWLSDSPWADAQTIWNPMFSILVTSETQFKVFFSLLPATGVAPIPNPYVIGAAAGKRVDFAGVLLTGVRMSAQTYRSLVAAMERTA